MLRLPAIFLLSLVLLIDEVWGRHRTHHPKTTTEEPGGVMTNFGGAPIIAYVIIFLGLYNIVYSFIDGYALEL